MPSADAICSEVRGYLKLAAGRDPKTVERAIECAARALDIDYSRAWGIWYGKINRLWADEVDGIRAKVQEVRAREIERTRATLAQLEREHAALTRQLEIAGSPNVDLGSHRAGADQAADPSGVEPRRRASAAR